MNAVDLPVVKEVAAELHKLYGDRLTKIILYGSYARGEQREESDIDFLVLLNDEKVSAFNEIDYFSMPMRRLSDKFQIEISVQAVDRNFLKKKNNLFAELIKEEGIPVS